MTKAQRILAGVLVVLAAGVAFFAIGRPVKVLPRMAPAPPFELLDPWGETVSAPAEDEAITFYTFGALRDAEGMAAIERFVSDAGRALAEAGHGERVRFRFISVDPDHDTPEALRQAIHAAQGSPLSEVTMLTGSWVAIRLVVGTGFGVYYEPPQASDHPTETAGPPRYDPTIIVVDDDHVIRARYPLQSLDTATLVRDVNLLAKEAEAQGATRWIYEGAHLFLCYPR